VIGAPDRIRTCDLCLRRYNQTHKLCVHTGGIIGAAHSDSKGLRSGMLVFIDTNIFLDFYRMGSGESAHRALKQIDEIKNHVITTYQVEMEFKKNRQRTIIETIKGIKQVDGSHKTMPPLLIDAQPTKIIRDNLKNIETQQKKIKPELTEYYKIQLGMMMFIGVHKDCLNQHPN
jgi:predicted nucleic acid-binding protein